jgi:gliding motility-associated-like protein
LLCALTMSVWAQNLLPNPSFEVNTGCPSSVGQLGLATGWSTPAGHAGSADYLHVCGTSALVQVPANAFGNQVPFQGNAYIGFALYYQAAPDFREYAVAPLTQTLLAGQTYEISTYYSLADESTFATDKLQFYFSNVPTTWPFGNWSPMTTYVPQASIATGTYLNDKVNWTRVSANYTAVGGEQFVTIGNFLDDLNTPTQPAGAGTYTTCYIYLDSVVLRALSPNPTGAAPDTTICPGACYQLWAMGDSSYAWTTTTNAVPFSTADSVIVCPLVTTSYVVTGANSIDTVTVTVLPSAPTIVLGADTTICQGQTVTLNAGVPGLTYVWTPGGAVTQSITVGAAGNYQVVASNACGSDSDAVLVTVQPHPSPFIGNDTSICFGAGLSLNAGPGYTGYLWSTGAITPSITVTTSGTYTVTVTAAGGCQGSDTITVGVGLPLGLLVTATRVSCNGGSDGTATALGSGSAPLSYVWSAAGSPTTATVTGLPAGNYFVTVTDAFGCTRVGGVTITAPQAMQSSITHVDQSCPGRHDGTALVSVNGGTLPYSYLWSTGDLTPNVDSLAPGNYAVTVTDAFGCTSSASVTIGSGAGVVATTLGTASFCEGSGGDTLHVAASGGVAPYYYQWSCNVAVGPCGLDSIFDNDPIANPGVSGWYYVQVTDGSGCQSNLDSIWVEVLPLPIVNAGPDIILCGDNAPCQILSPTIAAAPGPFAYQWLPSTGLNNAFIANPCARPDTTTIYALVVTAGNGCSSNFTTTDTLATATVHVNPIPVADAGPDQHICLTDSALLEGLGTAAGPIYQFQWTPSGGLAQPSSGNTMASPPLTTTYTLVVWSNGCPSYGDDMTLYVHTLPTVNAGPDREICLGDSILIDAQAAGDSTASYGFIWSPGGTISDTHTEDPRVWPSSTTTYYVEARSNFGCGSTFDSVLVTLLPSPIADAGPHETICVGQTFDFQGSYSYTSTNPANPNDVFQFWTPALGLSDPNSLTPSATPTASGLYILTVYTGLCSSQDSMLLTVVPALGLTAGADTSVICAGDSVWLQAGTGLSGVTFAWSPTTGLADPHAAGTMAAPGDTISYTVSAAAGGCLETAELTLAVIARPVASYVQSQPIGCMPLTVSFLENTPDALAYTWNFGDGSPVSNVAAPMHTFEGAGTYSVTLTAVNTGGCASTFLGSLIVVSEPLAAAFHSAPSFPVALSLPNTEVQFYNDAPGAMAYDWDFGDGIRSAEAHPSHTYAGIGTYYVTLTVTSGEHCVSKIVGGPFVVTTPDLFIPNVFSPNGDGVNDEYLVQYSGSQPFTLQIFDRWGVKVYEGNNKTKGWNGDDAKGNLVTEGVYFYHVATGDRNFAGQLTLVR